LLHLLNPPNVCHKQQTEHSRVLLRKLCDRSSFVGGVQHFLETSASCVAVPVHVLKQIAFWVDSDQEFGELEAG